MRIDQARMAEIYLAHLGEKKAAPGAECPAPEDLVRLVTEKVGRKERARILGHVSGCFECVGLLKSVLRLSDEIDRLWAEGEARGLPREEPPGIRLRRRFQGRRAALAGLAGAIALAVMTYSVIRLADKPVVRGTGDPEVRLIDPKKGAALPAGDIEFRWAAVPRAARYTVELFDGSLEMLWRSDRLTETAWKLPEEEAGRVLHEGEGYFWRVTAVLEDGRELVSKLAEFSIRMGR